MNTESRIWSPAWVEPAWYGAEPDQGAESTLEDQAAAVRNLAASMRFGPEQESRRAENLERQADEMEAVSQLRPPEDMVELENTIRQARPDVETYWEVNGHEVTRAQREGIEPKPWSLVASSGGTTEPGNTVDELTVRQQPVTSTEQEDRRFVPGYSVERTGTSQSLLSPRPQTRMTGQEFTEAESVKVRESVLIGLEQFPQPEGHMAQHPATHSREALDQTRQQVRQLQEQLRQRYPNLDIYMKPDAGDIVRVETLNLPTNERLEGQGTRAMSEIVETAERNGWDLSATPSDLLDASSSGRKPSKSGAERLMKSNGFVNNSGGNKEFRTMATMIRPASSPEQPSASLDRDVELQQQLNEAQPSASVDGPGLGR